MNQQVSINSEGDSALQHPGLIGPVLITFRVTAQPEFLLPGSDQFPAYPLSPHALLFLESLAGSGAENASAPFSPEQQNLLDELRHRRLLQDSFAPVPGIDGEHASLADSADSEEGILALIRPFVLRLDSNGFNYLDHEGCILIRMSARELAGAVFFGRARSVQDGFETQRKGLHKLALAYPEYMALVKRLLQAGLLHKAEHVTVIEDRAKLEFLEAMQTQGERRAIVQGVLDEAEKKEIERRVQTGRVRTKVIPVQKEHQPLLSHGLLMSYAMAYEDGRLQDSYEFITDWCNLSVPSLQGDEEPAIFLFSNYIWSHTANMAYSQRAKEMNPMGVCIHGGPDTPKYAGDVKRYLELNQHIDVIVHGEGEAALAEILDTLQEQMAEGPRDITVLKDVPGITYRVGDKLVTTAARDRLSNLNTIPSPYSNGLFDVIGDLPIVMQTIETNRGCPFGCTFCDWGSATLSKIRKFDLERVFQDLEWCAKHKVKVVFNTDANFGVFERDVEVARKVVELKERYGYPKVFESSYAKNQVKHLKKIIEILAGGGVVSTGTLSLQSVNPETLSAIKRSNIKVSKYDELATEFGKAKLPLIVEMMMGLPGSTLESFEGDLQQAIDREVQARVNPTEVLVNSPMNEPGYRTEYDIHLQRPIEDDWRSENGTTPPDKALIVSTSSFTASDYKVMDRWRQLFLLMENYGVLRQVARFVRYETGIKEMVFYRQLDESVGAQPNRWPTIAFTMNFLKDLMVPPGSWRNFIDEVHDYLVTELDIPDDSALQTVLQVQHALLPSRDRTFPHQIELAHDYSQWHSSMLASKQVGWEQDWTPNVEPLRTMGPTSFIVEDSQHLSTFGMGTPLGTDSDFDWEFDSPVGRALRFRRTAQLN